MTREEISKNIRDVLNLSESETGKQAMRNSVLALAKGDTGVNPDQVIRALLILGLNSLALSSDAMQQALSRLVEMIHIK